MQHCLNRHAKKLLEFTAQATLFLSTLMIVDQTSPDYPNMNAALAGFFTIAAKPFIIPLIDRAIERNGSHYDHLSESYGGTSAPENTRPSYWQQVKKAHKKSLSLLIQSAGFFGTAALLLNVHRNDGLKTMDMKTAGRFVEISAAFSFLLNPILIRPLMRAANRWDPYHRNLFEIQHGGEILSLKQNAVIDYTDSLGFFYLSTLLFLLVGGAGEFIAAKHLCPQRWEYITSMTMGVASFLVVKPFAEYVATPAISRLGSTLLTWATPSHLRSRTRSLSTYLFNQTPESPSESSAFFPGGPEHVSVGLDMSS